MPAQIAPPCDRHLLRPGIEKHPKLSEPDVYPDRADQKGCYCPEQEGAVRRLEIETQIDAEKAVRRDRGGHQTAKIPNAKAGMRNQSGTRPESNNVVREEALGMERSLRNAVAGAQPLPAAEGLELLVGTDGFAGHEPAIAGVQR